MSSDKRKRQQTSVERSAQWLKGMLEGTRSTGVDVFGVVTGGTVPGLRAEAARAIAAQGVKGVVLGGLGCGESPAERAAALEEMVGALPDELPRMLVGVDGPWEVLKAVGAGVDVLDSAYAHKLAELGYACTFPIDLLGSGASASGASAGDASKLDADGDTPMGAAAEAAGTGPGPPSLACWLPRCRLTMVVLCGEYAGASPSFCPGDSTKICLLDQRFTLDAAPLVPGCTCFACRKHTRA